MHSGQKGTHSVTLRIEVCVALCRTKPTQVSAAAGTIAGVGWRGHV
jgi:hypothetical protein